ncbi:hypothetical protein [Nocardia sp. alder85J]|uniref:hypothetical protein n=1 Tax=Nocardia sp. alder85J TaxID=2862949 RepID=UPI001CD7FE0C|nr:hypothetical protein [Nocardia sp. alder85J]MCX4098498.1 hypothetical protein [Nocardia sp. alder85J]
MSDPMSIVGPPPDDPPMDRAELLGVLLDSAWTIVARTGLGSLTVQALAVEAGISLTAAPAQFASAARQISELLWRQMTSAPRTGVRRTLRSDALDVLHLRDRTAGEIRHRIAEALGPQPDDSVAARLETIYTAALFDAGTGYADSRDGRAREQVVWRILDRR